MNVRSYHTTTVYRIDKNLLRAPCGARNINLQVAVIHAQHVCRQHSFELPLTVNGMLKTQSDHARLDLPPLVI